MFESNFPVDSISIGYGVLWKLQEMAMDTTLREARAARGDGAPRLPHAAARRGT